MELRAIWQVFSLLAIDSDSTFKFLLFTAPFYFCFALDSIQFGLI